MDKLPPELLERVLMYLPPSDRLASALTCRRWAQAVSSSSLLKDVWLKSPGLEQSSFEAIVIGSERQYRNLHLSMVDLESYGPEFWTRIGKNLRNLELQECSLSNKLFFRIVDDCVKLESVKFLYPDRCTAVVFRVLSPLMIFFKSVSFSRSEKRRDLVEISLSGPRRRITELKFTPAIEGEGGLARLVRASSTSLRRLRCHGIRFTHELYEAVCECTKLRHLSLQRPDLRFDDNYLRKLLLNAVVLKNLTLFHCAGLTGEDLVAILEHKELRELRLVGCQIVRTNGLLSILRELSPLEILDLRGTAIDVRVLLSVARLPNLREFRLDFDSLNSECLEVIFENFKNLDTLHMTNCHKLSDSDGKRIRHLEELKSLKIEDGFGFTDLTFKNGIGSAAMRCLSLRGCPLTDVGLASIAAHHSRLRTLSLYKCLNVTDAGLVTLLRSEPLLERLEILRGNSYGFGYSNRLTDNVLRALVDFCPRLRVLRIDSYYSMCEDAINRFKRRRPRVEVSCGS